MSPSQSSSQNRSHIACLTRKSPAGSPSRESPVHVLENQHGHTIEVKRGPVGQILVRHTRFGRGGFGIFRDPEAIAEAITKNGFDLDDKEVAGALGNLNRVCGARLELEGREYRLNKADAALIRQSIKELE